MQNSKFNVGEIVDCKLCLGCGTCMGICPENAIEMTYSSKNRTYIPIIDDKQCNECGLCLKVCPGQKVTLSSDRISIKEQKARIADDYGAYIKCFIGYAKNNDMRYKASSGGIATALSADLLEHNKVDSVIATQMKRGALFETEPILCRERSDLFNAMGSKYCPSAVNRIFKDLRSEGHKSICLVGLPCHIQGFENARKCKQLKNIHNIFSIGLLCGGMRGQEGSMWILKKKKIKTKEIRDIRSHRGHGWPGDMHIARLGGLATVKIAYPFEYDEYYESWQPWRCSLCLDRTAEVADISLGDAWLPELKDDHLGSSIILARTEKGCRIVEEAAANGAIIVREASIETLINAQRGLFNDIQHDVLPTLYIAKILKRRIPDYQITISKPNWTNFKRITKKLIINWCYRQISKYRIKEYYR